MTIEKIKELNLPDGTYADGTRQIEIKINQIIDWINEHDESGRHIIPVNSLTGGEKEEPKSNTLREKLAKIMRGYPSSDLNSLETADQILSLVKESILKDIAEKSRRPYGITNEEILTLIKNL